MKACFCVLDADYVVVDGEPAVRLWGKTESGKNIVVFDRNFSPYFLVEVRDERDLQPVIDRILKLSVNGRKAASAGVVLKKKFGKPARLIKVVVASPVDLRGFRDAVKVWKEVRDEYEYTIPFYRRYMIDRGIAPLGMAEAEGSEIETNFNVDIALDAKNVRGIASENSPYPETKLLAFDIEAAHENGEEKIIMVSVFGKNIRKAITYRPAGAAARPGGSLEIAGSEEEMIKKFIEYVQMENPDILATFNGDMYDFQKLEDRAKKYKMQLALGRDGKPVLFRKRAVAGAARLRGIVHIDILPFVSHILRQNLSANSITLDNVAREIIGSGKEKMSREDIEDAWNRGDTKTIASHCLKDSELTCGLAEQLLPQIYELSRVTGQIPFDASRMTYSQLVEWLLVRKAYESGEIVANTPKYEEIAVRRKAVPYTGGYVHTPREGLHKKIALFDFVSLYPSIIVTHNISPDTINCDCCGPEKSNLTPGGGKYFCAKKKGFIAEVIGGLVRKRKALQEEMKKLNPKVPGFRALDSRQYVLKIIANAAYGYYGYPGSRWYSRICAESITAFGRYYIKKVIEAAEKSGYEVIYGDTDSLFMKVKSRKEADSFMEKINRKLPGIIELNLHGLYPLGIFVLGKTETAAKKRYALIDDGGVITIKGFETVRRDWADVVKDMQEKIFSAVLREKSIEKAVRVARKVVSDIRNGKVKMDELIIHTQITRPLDQYEQIGPHVAAARKLANRGKTVREGSTIEYVITRGAGSISQRAEPFEHAQNYDPDYYIHHQVIPAAMRILGGLGVKEDDFTGKESREQASIEKFIKGKRKTK
jgi:DNA polymerase I/DNA polymerase-2